MLFLHVYLRIPIPLLVNFKVFQSYIYMYVPKYPNLLSINKNVALKKKSVPVSLYSALYLREVILV